MRGFYNTTPVMNTARRAHCDVLVGRSVILTGGARRDAISSPEFRVPLMAVVMSSSATPADGAPTVREIRQIVATSGHLAVFFDEENGEPWVDQLIGWALVGDGSGAAAARIVGVVSDGKEVVLCDDIPTSSATCLRAARLKSGKKKPRGRSLRGMTISQTATRRGRRQSERPRCGKRHARVCSPKAHLLADAPI